MVKSIVAAMSLGGFLSVQAINTRVFNFEADPTTPYSCNGIDLTGPTLDDLSMPCGSDENQPCLIAIYNPTDATVMCDRVYRLGMPSAMNGIDSTIFVKVVHAETTSGGSNPEAFGLSQPAVRALCHSACVGEDACVDLYDWTNAESCPQGLEADTIDVKGVIAPGSSRIIENGGAGLDLPYQCVGDQCSDDNKPGDLTAVKPVLLVGYEDATETGDQSCHTTKLTEDQLVDGSDACGGATNPCIAGWNALFASTFPDVECGKCYSTRVVRPELDGPLCSGNTCNQISREMYIEMVEDQHADLTRRQMIMLPHSGYKKACPYQCTTDGTAGVRSVCVEVQSECENGVVAAGTEIDAVAFKYQRLGSYDTYGVMITNPVEVPCGETTSSTQPPGSSSTDVVTSTEATSGATGRIVGATMSLALLAGSAAYLM